jgi:hypothetical protein
MKNTNQFSQQVLNNIAVYMNEDIREDLHFKLAPCEPKVFLQEYCKRDVEFTNVLKTEFGIEMEDLYL